MTQKKYSIKNDPNRSQEAENIKTQFRAAKSFYAFSVT